MGRQQRLEAAESCWPEMNVAAAGDSLEQLERSLKRMHRAPADQKHVLMVQHVAKQKISIHGMLKSVLLMCEMEH